VNPAFKNELHTLNREDSLIYCIHIAKRLWPDYVRFYEIENFGDVFLINDILQVSETFIKHGIKREEEIHELSERLDKAGPSSEDFPSVESTYALNACCCCYDILALLNEDDKEAAARSYEIALETIYIKVIDQQPDDYPEEQAYHSVEMQEEYRLQESLLQRIKSGNRPELITDTFSLNYRK
jgi:uncharacterized protein YjaG (DUF416 family)